MMKLSIEQLKLRIEGLKLKKAENKVEIKANPMAEPAS